MNQFFSLRIPKDISVMIAIRFCCLNFFICSWTDFRVHGCIMHFVMSGGQSKNL